MNFKTTRLGTVNLVSSIHRHRRWRPWMTWVAGLLGALLLWLGGSALYYLPKAQQALAAGREAVASGRNIPVHLSAQKFDQANEDVRITLENIRTTKEAVARMQGLRMWPYVGRQFSSVDTLLSVGDDSVQAMGTLVTFLKDIFEPFEARGKVSLSKITPAEKGQLLGNISAHGEELRAAQEKIHSAADRLATIPDSGLVGPLGEGVTQLKSQFPLITEALDQAIPASKILPTILGYPKEKLYLFLLENNTELRPGGGFIGTYGLMRVESGEIVSLKTDNVYNLDTKAKDLPVIKPPAPITKYLKVDRWFFRDSNWSPDFPTSAAEALFLYKREGGFKNVDGVIAITPTTIVNLLKLVGAIKVDGIEFTSENFVDRLQYEVERGFLRAGISDANRKDIIGDLTSALMQRLLDLPLAEWSDLFLTVSGDLEAKHILVWLEDDVVQNILVSQNWAGAVDPRTDTDYVMVVDANLASLKTDQVMLRNYSYTVKPDGDSAIATLRIKYQNTGKFDWKTTRYNTFIRVYTPAGSTLIDSSGSQARERSNAPGTVETSSELGKTVFATFKSIEPQTASELVLTYRLPATALSKWKDSGYELIWQKQPGMLPPDVELDIELPKKPRLVEGVDNLGRIREDTVTFTGRLSRDRTVTVQY